jgi:hypothetical protein
MYKMGLSMRNRGRVSVLIIIVIVILLIPQLFFIPVKANPFTTVNLSFQGDPPCVDVSPGSSGIVTITGEVTCVKWGPDSVKVFLVAQSDTGNASVVPPSFVFTGSSGTTQTETFSVTTRVPQGYSSSANPSITVSGYYDQGGLRYTIAPISQIIIILQYYKIGASVKDTVIQAESGDNVNIWFNVFNEGNGEDVFLIDLENRGGLEGKGFQLPTLMEVPIDEDGCRNISYEVGIPKNVSGIHTFDLCIISKGSESSGSICKYKMTITLDVAPKSQEDDGNGINPIDFGSDELNLLPIGLVVLIIVIISLVVLALSKRRRIEVTYI